MSWFSISKKRWDNQQLPVFRTLTFSTISGNRTKVKQAPHRKRFQANMNLDSSELSQVNFHCQILFIPLFPVSQRNGKETLAFCWSVTLAKNPQTRKQLCNRQMIEDIEPKFPFSTYSVCKLLFHPFQTFEPKSLCIWKKSNHEINCCWSSLSQKNNRQLVRNNFFSR